MRHDIEEFKNYLSSTCLWISSALLHRLTALIYQKDRSIFVKEYQYQCNTHIKLHYIIDHRFRYSALCDCVNLYWKGDKSGLLGMFTIYKGKKYKHLV